ncbi:MAG: Holliday junction branch migration protein RuvA [Desulfovibrionaceae bacterium]
MIAYIEGRLLEHLPSGCVIATDSGVGYEIALPTHTLARLSEKGASLAFYTHFVVREDAQELYGFDTWDERLTFQVLVSISKVGAKTALSILSLYRPDDLRRLVFEDDYMALTHVSGIGKKTAQHVFLELKYKLKADTGTSSVLCSPVPSIFKDALDGLANLGYAEEEAGPVLKKLLTDEPDLDVSGALRGALRLLARGM